MQPDNPEPPQHNPYVPYQGPPQYTSGHPPQQYPATYVNTYQQQPDPNTEQAKKEFFNVAKWGVWTWIAVTLLPILVVLMCCGFCGLFGFIGSANS